MDNDLIYLDHAATTPLHPEVLEAMLPFFREGYGNPSSVYSLGRKSRRALDDARESVSAALNCSPQEIIFTGSGTEADNLALKGVALAWLYREGSAPKAAPKVIITTIEHHAILHTADFLEKIGCEVVRLPVDSQGVVSLAALESALDENTAIISIMTANNEIGTIQPIAEAAGLIREKAPRALFHTDAVQAGGSLKLDVDDLGVDFLSLSAHKFYGPKGVGLLYARRGSRYWPQTHGGSQERNRRAGTENVAGVVGLARGLGLAMENLPKRTEKMRRLRDRLVEGIRSQIPDAVLTGHPTRRLPNNASFCFLGIEAEALLLALDSQGIMASSGSACASASLEASHVLSAIGLPAELAHGSLRLSTGIDNTDAQVERALGAIVEAVGQIRPARSGV